MTRSKERQPRKPRILKARPLLVAVGAAALLAGCGDDTTTVSGYDMGFARIQDMARATPDLGRPATD